MSETILDAKVRHLNAIIDDRGDIQLYDIYIENEWIGSRRTEAQCLEQIRNAGFQPIHQLKHREAKTCT